MRDLKIFIFAFALGLLLSGCGGETQPAPQPEKPVEGSASAATDVYINGDIITVNDKQPTVEAVAVRDGKIFAVGSRYEVESAAGKKANIKDLAGKTLVPGFIDAHGHMTFTAQTVANVNLASPPVGSAQTIGDIVQLLKDRLQQRPDEPWLIGWGYDDSLLKERRYPTRDDLDKVSKEVPILIRHVSGHLVSCNSKCLEMANITAETADPKGGVIRRQAGGKQPDGVLEETAQGLVYPVLPQPDAASAMQLLQQALQYYASHGITTAQDGAVGPQEIKLLSAAAQQGLLDLDVAAYTYLQFPDSSEDAPQFSKQYQKHFRLAGVKMVLDGSPQGKTAWLTRPYYKPPAGQKKDYRGYPTLEYDKVEEQIKTAYANHVQVLAHANGDAAADQLIKAVAAAGADGKNSDRRTVMIHAQTVREDQLDKMQALGIIPSYFVTHTFYWGDWHRDSVLGPERAKRISPLQSTLDRDMPFTIHNDAPVVPPDMLRLMWSAVTRTTRSGKVLGEEQRITPLDALKSVTLNAAYQYFEEDSKGSIERGKLADFTLLSANPLSVDAQKIKDIKVLETIKEGKTIYRREAQ